MPNLAYDTSTPLGQTRFYAADTDVSDAVALFTDAELTMLLGGPAKGNPMLAAAYALKAKARDYQQNARLVKVGPITVDSRDVAKGLSALADGLIKDAASYTTSTFDPPDRVFTTDRDDGETVGTMTGW